MEGRLYVAFSIIFVWIIAELFIGRWMFKAKPDKSIVEKYSKMVIIAASLPFGSSWKKKVEKNHISVLEAYQFRVRICFFSIVVSLLVFYAYIFIGF